jgi:hypothetical protein
MNIKKVKLINGGFKGAAVSWTEERVEKNKRKYVDELDKEKNDPIHLGLDKPFKDLRYHLLNICGIISTSMDQTEIDYAIGECEVDAIDIDGGTFVIHGSKVCIANKSFKIKTPKVNEDDGYDKFDEVVELIKNIKEEAQEYIKGTTQVSDQEAAIRFITSGKDKSIDMAEYEIMSAEEKAQLHIDIIQKLGGFVTMPGDVLEDTDENHEILNMTPEKEISDAEVIEIDLNDDKF